MEAGLIVAVEGGVARLKLTRPEARNSLTREVCAAMRRAFAAFDRDSACTIVVIEGSGGAFASGADIGELDRLRADPPQLRALYRELRATQELVYRFERLTIAAIDGYCIGAGLSLALACDLCIATPRSVLRRRSSGCSTARARWLVSRRASAMRAPVNGCSRAAASRRRRRCGTG
jgi:2-(1,2-epoxy-1,2-dihydrophenyl)acetyl-CoA isomerase